MSKSSEAVKKWRRTTKKRMVDSMGGKCQCCSYDKCQDALEMHHLDPNVKEFSFGSVTANPISWKRICEELRKCILLCANCHREIHAGIRELPVTFQSFNESFVNYKVVDKIITYCPVCNNEKIAAQKTCSHSCAGKLTGKVNWDSVDLYNLLCVKKLSFSAIGRQLNISDNAVRKRAKKLNLI